MTPPRASRDRIVIAVLALLPFVVFLVPLAFGRVLLPGDDLIQNFPLRVLSGHDLRHGALPLWNPYDWSGTPLLAGFNAGSLYPLSLLFVFLPAVLAWALGQAATYAVAGTGMFLFLRRQGAPSPLAPVAAALGAAVFAWSGFMAAQLAHLGLVEGMSWAPWILLAVNRLTPGTRSSRHRAAWVALLGGAGGAVCLAGDPRAISDVAVVVGLYSAWRLWRAPGRRRLAFVLTLAAGAALAGLIGCAQLLPGLQLQAASQRAVASYQDFGAGSLGGPQVLLSADPFVLGGFNSLHLPAYLGDENLPELTGYVGLLTLAGALAMVGSLRRRRQGPGLWIVVAGLGLLMAAGNRTPIGHLFYDIPLYGGQRLQARNLGVVDLALAVLFAYWVDRFLIVPARRTARALALLAPGVVLAMIGLGLGWPGGLGHWMKSPTEVFPRTWPFSVVAGGLAVAVIAIVLLGHRWRRRVRARAVVLVTLVDVAFFFANAAYGFAATSALATGSPAAGNLGAGSREVAQMLPPGTRYLVADPSVVYSGYTNVGAGLAPVPDFNVLGALPSVQGYGSLVSDGYEAATGAHDQGAVLPQMVGGDLADRLQLGLVLVATSDPLVGGLRPALTAPRWEPVGQVDGLAAWRNTNVLPPAYLAPGPGTTSVASGGTAADGSATFLVDATTASTLVRSEAYSPGWKATLRPAPGPGSGAVRGVRDETVTAAGILQGAAVPAGRWLVTFHYHPDRAYLGIELGLLGALLCLLTAGGPALLGTLRRTYRNSLRDALERALPRRLSPPARPPTSGAGRRPAR